ncbi:MAG TPA: dipeptide/oligopeptide/nickel ABC transporter permease/ATP-binding protein [Hyphomicrobiaceae bacterium]|nr:dipeptide/oligopeptide/nickel ABC transporter permease/ATP-binding protein [Hyphomicrobiaceae bacterium]
MRRWPLRLTVPGALVAVLILIALAVPLLGLPDPIKQDVPQRLLGGIPGSPLGRDEFGRDVLSRLLWGARTSLYVAFAAAAIACLVGTTLGLLGGWLRGLAEIMTLRVADVVLCFPPILLALLVVSVLGPGDRTLVVMLSILYTPGFMRVAFGEVLSTRNLDYVTAVSALGAGTSRILARSILPNIAGPLLVQFSLTLAAAVVVESGLSFLGLGVVPPTPSWGLMIRGARATMEQAPLLLLWPCLALTVTILAINLLCDALRDWLDPRTAPAVGATRGLLDRLAPGLLPSSDIRAPGLKVEGLTVAIATPQSVIRPVEDVSFEVPAGGTLAIVGESGSGKSLTALALIGLLPPVARAVKGRAMLDGENLLTLDEAALRRLRGNRIAMIFQDPMSSLNPVRTAGAQVIEAILAHRQMAKAAARAEAIALFKRVGIADPERRIDAFPHELSGGMRQRVMIAMAIANKPALLIADEPTTALDVTVQAQILELLAELRRETGASLIFISHSLGVVSEIADHVVVMYAGEVVESGPVALVFEVPLHPYTKALLAAVPDGERAPKPIPGTVPPPDRFPAGCRFRERCASAIEACAERQVLAHTGDGHRVACAVAMSPDAARGAVA